MKTTCSSILQKSILPLTLFLLSSVSQGQTYSLTFTSSTDAKFFVYINGVLQNHKPSGIVTVPDLLNKDYHVRLVVDDPFLVATTTTIKPDSRHSEYSVTFNAVKEKVTLKLLKPSHQYPEASLSADQPASPPADTSNPAPPIRRSIRPPSQADSISASVRHRVRTIFPVLKPET